MLLPVKRFIARQIFWTGPLVRLMAGSPIERHGVSVDIAPDQVHDNVRTALFWGYYEAGMRRAVCEVMRRDLPVVELGGGLGFITTLIAQRTRAEKQIAFEADPGRVPLLRDTLERNDCTGVTIVRRALDYTGAETVVLGREPHIAARHVSSSESSADGENVVKTPATTLNQVLDEHDIGDFVLISDIEGAELDVFEGEASEAGPRCRQAIVEVHPVERNGRSLGRDEVARRLCDAWIMEQVRIDGDIRVLEPRSGDN